MNKLSIIIPVYNEDESFSKMITILQNLVDIDHEVIIIYDNESDTTIPEVKKFMQKFTNIKLIKNKFNSGVKNAIDTGIENASNNIILITVVDEIFPILSIKKMFQLIINQNYDLVSATRYSKGGIRYGGNFLGKILSIVANKILLIFTKGKLSDATTGIKMMKKDTWKSINFESNPVGWAFMLELSLKAYLKNLKISEVPCKSIDRLFGGRSTFNAGPWIKEYLRWFVWGIINIIKK